MDSSPLVSGCKVGAVLPYALPGLSLVAGQSEAARNVLTAPFGSRASIQPASLARHGSFKVHAAPGRIEASVATHYKAIRSSICGGIACDPDTDSDSQTSQLRNGLFESKSDPKKDDTWRSPGKRMSMYQ